MSDGECSRSRGGSGSARTRPGTGSRVRSGARTAAGRAARRTRAARTITSTASRTWPTDGRAVIHYDQIGNGRSTHLPDRGADFWTVDLFLDELDNLLAHLGIADRYHLLGQSWGGMLGAEQR